MDEIYKYIRRGQVENKQGEAENYNEDTNKRDPFWLQKRPEIVF